METLTSGTLNFLYELKTRNSRVLNIQKRTRERVFETYHLEIVCQLSPPQRFLQWRNGEKTWKRERKRRTTGKTKETARPKRSDSGERRNLGKASEKRRETVSFPAFFRSLFSTPLPYSSHLSPLSERLEQATKEVSAEESGLLLCVKVRCTTVEYAVKTTEVLHTTALLVSLFNAIYNGI